MRIGEIRIEPQRFAARCLGVREASELLQGDRQIQPDRGRSRRAVDHGAMQRLGLLEPPRSPQQVTEIGRGVAEGRLQSYRLAIARFGFGLPALRVQAKREIEVRLCEARTDLEQTGQPLDRELVILLSERDPRAQKQRVGIARIGAEQTIEPRGGGIETPGTELRRGTRERSTTVRLRPQVQARRPRRRGNACTFSRCRRGRVRCGRVSRAESCHATTAEG